MFSSLAKKLPLIVLLGYSAPAAGAAPPQSVRDLVRCDAATLDALYAAGGVGESSDVKRSRCMVSFP